MRFCLVGYYGFGNVGDELILRQIAIAIKNKYPGSVLTVLSHRPDETRQDFNVRSISRWNPIQILKSFWTCDCVLVGGGGLLQNQTSSRSLSYYLLMIGLSIFLRKKVFLYAVGVEHLKGTLAQRITRFMLNHPSVTITVRDSNSEKTLSSIGVSGNKINVTADPVFGMDWQVEEEKDKKRKVKKVILIGRSVGESVQLKAYSTLEKVAHQTDQITLKKLLFQSESGENLIQAVSSKENEIQKEIDEADCIISSRYHGLVLAALAQKPFIGLGDPVKTKRITDPFKMPYLSWDFSEADAGGLLKKIDDLNAIFNPSTKADLQKQARRTIDYLPI